MRRDGDDAARVPAVAGGVGHGGAAARGRDQRAHWPSGDPWRPQRRQRGVGLAGARAQPPGRVQRVRRDAGPPASRAAQAARLPIMPRPPIPSGWLPPPRPPTSTSRGCPSAPPSCCRAKISGAAPKRRLPPIARIGKFNQLIWSRCWPSRPSSASRRSRRSTDSAVPACSVHSFSGYLLRGKRKGLWRMADRGAPSTAVRAVARRRLEGHAGSW
jgi:hypothetical protein